MRRPLAALVLLFTTSCDLLGGARGLSDTDCKPRHLNAMHSCTGTDSSFQECQFYFRATGVPDHNWCASVTKSSAQELSALSECDLAHPESWSRVRCAHYGILGAALCYGCISDDHHETRKTYVYAYSSDCSRGLEQVTCNVDPIRASQALGNVEL